MSSWQPPIPAGALYSKPARELGPGIALLAYCYDLVQRDGWLDISLTDAAGDMEEPYQNVKRWWVALRKGPFFGETIDRGRRGWRVKFRPVWIDWRILSTRPQMKDISSTDEGTEVILENNEVHLKDISSTDEGTEVILEPRMYKVLHDDHESSSPPVEIKKDIRTPDRRMVMMLIGKGVQSEPVANEIASMGLDYETVEQSIDNMLAGKSSIATIVRFLRSTPPEAGNPYPRARSPNGRASQVSAKPAIPDDVMTPSQVAALLAAKRGTHGP